MQDQTNLYSHQKGYGAYVFTFFLSFGTWIILSGKFDAFHLTLGVISSILISLFSTDLLFLEGRPKGMFRKFIGVIAYIPWLIYQVVLANLHVLYLSLHPRMLEKINPQVIKFQSQLKSELSMVLFANSITLTPGTITIYVSVDGVFQVHAIDDEVASSLPGDMEVRVGKAFGEL